MAGRLLDVKEAAELFDVPHTWFYKHSTDGTLPTRKIGKYVRFSLDDLMEWAQGHRVKPTSPLLG